MNRCLRNASPVLVWLITLFVSACGGGGSGGGGGGAPLPPALVITSGSPPSGMVGVLYNPGTVSYCQPSGTSCFPCFIAASDRICGPGFRTVYTGTGRFAFAASLGMAPYLWSWAPQPSSSLPPGLTLSADGSITGTPTAKGSYNITVSVKDSASPAATGSGNYTFTIAAATAPTIISGAPPAGILNLAYSFNFLASGGQLPLSWSETGTLPPGVSLNASGVLSGAPTATGAFTIIVSAQDAAGQKSVPQTVTIDVTLNGFRAAGSMVVARDGHTATLLLDRTVLIAGGETLNSTFSFLIAAAELFDETNGEFTATGSMATARTGHSATLLANAALATAANYGKVLVTGGGVQTAELYDPATRLFTATGSLLVIRTGETATLLNTGKVLVAGGGTATAELYDPASGLFTATAGSMTVARTGHTATLLQNGKVLVAGGGTATAELYDPVRGLFTATGSMTHVRSGATATLLQDGTVLVIGPDTTGELFDPGSSSFALLSLLNGNSGRSTASLLGDGNVLIAGGSIGRLSATSANAQLFSPISKAFTATGALNTARYGHSAAVLADGAVLIAGGAYETMPVPPFLPYSTSLSSAEIYQ